MQKSIPSAHKTTLNSISPKQNYRKQVFLWSNRAFRYNKEYKKAARLQNSGELSICALKNIIIDTGFQINECKWNYHETIQPKEFMHK